MKSIALIVFILAFTAMIDADDIQDEREKARKVHGECQADPATKIDADAMDRFFRDEAVNEAQVAKHSLCMHKKMGLQNENGDIDKDFLRKLIGHDNNVDEIVAECGQRRGSAEETTLALLKCMKKYRQRGDEHHHHGH